MRVSVTNRGPDDAALHLVPQFWARNMWSWSDEFARARIHARATARWRPRTRCTRRCGCSRKAQPELLFCENETNVRRLYGIDAAGYFKDGINDFLVRGEMRAVNPALEGSKCGLAVSASTLAPGGSTAVRLRLRPASEEAAPFDDFDLVMAERIDEADEFYAALQRGIADPERRLVQRQALAGMLWSKQFYYFDVRHWLAGDPGRPPPPPERPAGSECRMAASEQLRHHRDARHLGVSLVRVVGPGLPLHHVGGSGSGIRQVAARDADARVVHASERPAARL